MRKNTCLLALAGLLSLSLRAEVRLPLLFGDNMVIQRDQPVAVWGWATPGENVTVQFHGQTQKTRAGKNGQWLLHLTPETAGGPYTMTITGKNQVKISNVLVGEVWICSGQSNMEFHVRDVQKAQAELASADLPEIRQFEVPKTISISPLDTLSGGKWQLSNPANTGGFTAVGFFFARELYRRLHIPVGLIHTSWGGTQVESWTSRGAFEKSEEFKQMISEMPDEDAVKGLAAKRGAALEKNIRALQGNMPAPGAETAFRNPGFDDSRWPRMKLPGIWESAGIGLDNLDGVVWYRRTITIADADAGKPATLELGKIDDNDTTWVNGIPVGNTHSYSEKRVYNIPAGVLKAGKNIIAVRVEDTGGGGGIYGEPGELQCTIGDKVLSLAGEWSFQVNSYWIVQGLGPNSCPSLLFNGMVHPLIPYTIRGAIWYQGEANAGRAIEYRKSFPLMIRDWRNLWRQGDFPFYFVQLATFDANHGSSQTGGSTWAELRESQTKTLSLPNTGMAVTTDIGESHDIHPRNKQDVGLRLAAIALHNTYGGNGEFSGPLYQQMQVSGDSVRIQYTHTGSGLTAHDPYGYIRGFELAGAD